MVDNSLPPFGAPPALAASATWAPAVAEPSSEDSYAWREEGQDEWWKLGKTRVIPE